MRIFFNLIQQHFVLLFLLGKTIYVYDHISRFRLECHTHISIEIRKNVEIRIGFHISIEIRKNIEIRIGFHTHISQNGFWKTWGWYLI